MTAVAFTSMNVRNFLGAPSRESVLRAKDLHGRRIGLLTKTAGVRPFQASRKPLRRWNRTVVQDAIQDVTTTEPRRDAGEENNISSLSDVVKVAIELPWTKLASWVVAGLAFYQLHDFFGVCCGLSCCDEELFRSVLVQSKWADQFYRGCRS